VAAAAGAVRSTLATRVTVVATVVLVETAE
jgi:hypothetical protein